MARYSGKISYLKAPNCEEILPKTKLKVNKSRNLFGKTHFECNDVSNFEMPLSQTLSTNKAVITVEEAFKGTHLVEVNEFFYLIINPSFLSLLHPFLFLSVFDNIYNKATFPL